MSLLLRLLLIMAMVHACIPLNAQTLKNAAQPNIMDLQQVPVTVQPTKALLWEVSHPEVEKPSYIYGILQVISGNYFFLPPGLTPVVESTDRLMMEVNPMDHGLDHLYRGMTPVDSTLEVLLPKKEYEALYDFVIDSLSALSRYKLESRYAPTLLARQIMCDYCLGFSKRNQYVNYEQYLFRAIEKPFMDLGTGWTRTAWIDEYSIKEQTDQLVETLSNRNQLCNQYRALMKAYRQQDLDKVWLLAKDSPDLGSNMNQFIQARNAEWLQTLSWRLKYESLFIAVSSVQLPGEYGLLHQLRKLGFKIIPVAPKP